MAVTGIDPISLYAAAVEADLETALWLRPAEGIAFVGIGRAWATEPEGETRFRAAEAAWRDLVRDARIDRPAGDGRGAGPVLLGAMGFTGRVPAADDVWSPFGPSSLVLPELLLSVTPGGATVTGSMVGDGPDGDGPDGDAPTSPVPARSIPAPSSVAGTSSRNAPATSPPTRTAWLPGPSSPR